LTLLALSVTHTGATQIYGKAACEPYDTARHQRYYNILTQFVQEIFYRHIPRNW